MTSQESPGIFADVSTGLTRAADRPDPSPPTTTAYRDGNSKTSQTTRPSYPRQGISAAEKNLDWVDHNVVGKGKDAYERVGSMVSSIEKGYNAVSDPVNGALNTMADSNDASFRAIADNITTWAEKSQALMKTLDSVAQVHPIIGVVVLVFKTAVELEMQRRDNDRKVSALRVLRLDMMSVLCDLRHVSDTASVAGDGGLSHLIKQAKEDIKACSQACEKYLQKKLLVKLLKSNSWHTKLDSFSKRFQNRKAQFQFALSVYTSKGVSQANEAIGVVQGTIDTTKESVNMMLLFKYLESPSERALMAQIRSKGGASKVLASDKLLRELVDKNPSALATSTLSGASGDRSVAGDESRTIQGLKKDLNESIDSILQKERALFDAKFDVQTKLLADVVEEKVTRQSDRVIETVLAGPGDRIKDKAIHAMWKEMAWKTSARTTRFVLALRDYYLETYTEHPAEDDAVQKAEDTDKRLLPEPLLESDRWTLSYIGFPRLQAISESFDDDASGFVTVQEVNAFTSARPMDWSVPRWIAYWAFGWHLSMRHYAYALNHRLVPSMLRMSQRVLMSNKGAVDRYLISDAFRTMNVIFMSLNHCNDNDHLLERFQVYVDSEERRLDSQLKALAYEIDDLNTLKLITGPGRLERFLLPLIYVLLSHHYRLIELSTRETVPEEEFLVANDGLGMIWLAAHERVQMLKDVYEQQHIEVDKQMERCMHGLFHSLHSSKKVEVLEKEEEYPAEENTEGLLNGRLERRDLKHLPNDDEIHNLYRADDSADATPNHSSDTESLAGWWDGVLYDDGDAAISRISLRLIPSPGDGAMFSGSGIGPWGPFKVQPIAKAYMEGNIVLRLLPNTPGDDGMEFLTESFTNGVVTGGWWTAVAAGNLANGADTGRFVLERRSFLAVHCARPAPSAFMETRGHTLWSIARSGVLRQLWTWGSFRKRRAVRQRYVELTVKDYLYDTWSAQMGVSPLTIFEEEELTTLRVTLSTHDQELYRMIAERSSGCFMSSHSDIECDACNKGVGPVRFACMICIGDRVFDTIDLCFHHQDEAVGRNNEPDLMHNNSHPMLKARRTIHFRDFLRLRNFVKEYCDDPLSALRHDASHSSDDEEDDDEDDDAQADDENDASDTEKPTGEVRPVLPLKCIGCKQVLQAPYYVCIDDNCTRDGYFSTTLCKGCENDDYWEKWKIFPHVRDHLLLRVPRPSFEAKKPDPPSNPLVTRLASLEHQYAEHTFTMDQRFQKVEERLSRLEALLEKLALHLNVN